MTPPVGERWEKNDSTCREESWGGGGMSSPGQGAGESTYRRNDFTCTEEGEEGGEKVTPDVGSMIDRSGSILLRGENDPVRGANLLDQVHLWR